MKLGVESLLGKSTSSLGHSALQFLFETQHLARTSQFSTLLHVTWGTLTYTCPAGFFRRMPRLNRWH